MKRAALCLVALAVVALPTAASADEPWMVARMHQPFSPFETVTYEWKVAAGTPAVALTRLHVAGYGSDSGIALVRDEVLDGLFDGLYACESLVQTRELDAAAPPGEPWLDVRWRVNGTEHRAFVVGADAFAAASSCVDAVREPVLERVRVDAYVVPYWDEGEYGTLRATSSLPARLFVEERATGLITPVYGLRLAPGTYSVRWAALVTGDERVLTVRVQAGMTTSIDVRF